MKLKSKWRSWIVFIVGIIITRITIAEWIDNFYIALIISIFLISVADMIIESIFNKKSWL